MLKTEVAVQRAEDGYGFRVVVRLTGGDGAVLEHVGRKRYVFQKDADARADKLRRSIQQVAKRAK